LDRLFPDIYQQLPHQFNRRGISGLAFFIAYGVMSIPAGFLVERFTEKPVMVPQAVR
jgi:fucose permease